MQDACQFYFSVDAQANNCQIRDYDRFVIGPFYQQSHHLPYKRGVCTTMVHYPIRLKLTTLLKLSANKQKNAFHPLHHHALPLICAPFTRFLCSSVVERRTVNPYVTGSSPVRGANSKKPAFEQAFYFLITNALKHLSWTRTNLHRHSRSMLQRRFARFTSTSCPLINARKDGVTAMALFGQTHILHDCATAAHNFQPLWTIRFRCVFHWLINNCTRVPTGTLSNRYLISSLRNEYSPDLHGAQYQNWHWYRGGIQLANINRVQPHGVIGPRRTNAGKLSPRFAYSRRVFGVASRLVLLVYVQR